MILKDGLNVPELVRSSITDLQSSVLAGVDRHEPTYDKGELRDCA